MIVEEEGETVKYEKRERERKNKREIYNVQKFFRSVKYHLQSNR